jgi:hypothetical protein
MGFSSAVTVDMSRAVVLLISMSKSISSVGDGRRPNVEIGLNMVVVMGVLGPSLVLMVHAEKVGVRSMAEDPAESRWCAGDS